MIRPRLWIVALSTLTLSACVVAPRPYPVGYGGPLPGAPVASGVVVDLPPPAPYVEVIPAMPFAGALWLGGYWGWHGGRHQWVAGRWERPRPGYAWRPYAWLPQGGRWHLRAGGWHRG